jgi:hypothetical protein
VLRRKKASALSTHTDPLDYNYFTWYKNILSPLATFYKSILPEMIEATHGELKKSIAENGLRSYDAATSIRIIELYNSLEKQRENLASR